MGLIRKIFGATFLIFVVALLGFYWFVPTETFIYDVEPYNHNFTLNKSESARIQFYPAMRFPDRNISYKISEKCILKKKNEAELALEILENRTILSFHEVSEEADISVECDEKIRIEEDFFVAGEGGPVKVTRTKNFNVIHEGAILLIRSLKCERPNVAIHEFLHALGFNHSDNPNNVMYRVARCGQTMGDDIPRIINETYSEDPQPDLAFENVSATMQGRYLDVNVSVKNHGLKPSGKATIKITSGGDLIKEIEFEEADVGHGRILQLRNLFVIKPVVEEIEFFIDAGFSELNKKNNKRKLKRSKKD